MKVAVVILNYNGAELFPRFLPSVVDYSKDAELWVIDNGSTDHSLTWLKDNYPQIRQVTLKNNLGYCSGYNEGLQHIEADVFVLLNSDIEVTRDWLKEPLHLLDKNPQIATVQPKILSYRNRDRFEYAGAAGGFLDVLCYPYCRGRIFDLVEKDQGQFNDSCEVMWGSGACLFIRKSIFYDLGGFEPTFFAHMEEIDLCWRIRRAGFKNYYCGSSIVYHLGGGTLPVSSPRKTYLNFRNNISLMVRNLPAVDLVQILPLRLFLDQLAALKFLLEGNGASALSVLKAWIKFILNLKSEIRRRKATKNLPFISNKNLVKIKFLIIKRYLNF